MRCARLTSTIPRASREMGALSLEVYQNETIARQRNASNIINRPDKAGRVKEWDGPPSPAPFAHQYVDVDFGSVLAPAYADAALRRRNPPPSEAILHHFGLSNLGQLGPEAAAFVNLVKASAGG